MGIIRLIHHLRLVRAYWFKNQSTDGAEIWLDDGTVWGLVKREGRVWHLGHRRDLRERTASSDEIRGICDRYDYGY